MKLHCIAAIGILNSHSNTVFGKRKIIECSQEMMLIDANNLLWSCPVGHLRRWPPQEADRIKLGYYPLDLVERLMVGRMLEN